jgi:putative endonuclease
MTRKKIPAKNFWVYILYCENDSYYTGYTTDILRRYQQHLLGKASKYTRSFKPTGISQCWQIAGDKAAAMMLERQIKKLSKEEKKILLNYPERIKEIFELALPFKLC